MIERILEDINKVTGVKGALVAGFDGLVIASTASRDYDSEAICALASSIYSTVEKSMEDMNQGAMRQIITEGENGMVIMVAAGSGILVVLTEPSINLGLLRMEIKRSVSRIEAALG
jgi:hypothetical protein